MNFGCGPVLGGGIASLKFRQFKSCLWVDFCFGGLQGGVVCFAGCWGIRVTCFGLLGCLIDGWGLVIWLNVGLLVVNYLLRTIISFTCMCTTMTTGRLTWGVVFWSRLFVVVVPNLGCVGYVVEACIMLWLH